MKQDAREELKRKVDRAIRATAGCCIALAAVVVALILFSAVCAGMNLKETDPNAVLLGIVVLGLLALALAVGLIVALILARVGYRALRKLPPEQGNRGVQEENS